MKLVVFKKRCFDFSGLNTSPTTSVKHKKLSSRKSILAGSSPSVGAMTIAGGLPWQPHLNLHGSHVL